MDEYVAGKEQVEEREAEEDKKISWRGNDEDEGDKEEKQERWDQE